MSHTLLQELRRQFAALPPEEARRILRVYEKLIPDRVEDSMKEADR